MNEHETKICPKCGSKMENQTLEWKCQACGTTVCIEPEYCPPRAENERK
jgi:tRNA(Ile2) C34 agmatinyltransferase TiaS